MEDNVEFHDSYSSFCIVTVVKPRLWWTGHKVQMGETRNDKDFWFRKFLESGQLEDQGHARII